jgi:hypothetical protein
MLSLPLAVGQVAHSCLELVEASVLFGYPWCQQLVAARRRAPRWRWRHVGAVEQVGASALRVAVAHSKGLQLFGAALDRCGRWWWLRRSGPLANRGGLPLLVLVVSHAAVETVVDRGEHLLIRGWDVSEGVIRGWDVSEGVVRLVEVAWFGGWFSSLGQHGEGTRRQTVVSLDRDSRRCHPVGVQFAELPSDGVELVRS